jgi:hypothetical protein
LSLSGVKKDTLRACGFCGTVYSIDAPEYNGGCPNCKKKSQRMILDL